MVREKGDNHNNSLRDMLGIIFRHQYKVLVFFVVVVIVTVGMLFRTKDIYQSEAKLMIKIGRESVPADPLLAGTTSEVGAGMGALSSMMGIGQSITASEVEILKSRIVVEQVVDKIGAKHFFPDEKAEVGDVIGQSSPISEHQFFRDSAVDLLLESVEIETDMFNDIINLYFVSQNPELSRDTLRYWIDFYEEHHIEVHKSQASPEFLQKQTDKLYEKVTRKEELLTQFMRENSIVSLDVQKEMMLKEIGEFQTQINVSSSGIKSLHSTIAWLEKKQQENSPVTELSRVVGENRNLERIKGQLTDLRFKEIELAVKYPHDSRILRDLRERISFAEEELAREYPSKSLVTIGLDPTYQGIRAQLEEAYAKQQELIARKKFLGQEIVNKKKELEILATKGITLIKLQHEVEIAAQEYKLYLTNLLRSNISADLDENKISNIIILQPSSLPELPISSHKLRKLVLGVLFGFFGGICLAFVYEYLDDSLKSNDDIEKRLGLAVLVTVPYKGQV